MAGPSATTTLGSKSWFWRRNMAVTAVRRWAPARTKSLPLRHSPPIGRRTEWRITTRHNSQPTTAAAFSSLFTVPGIGRHIRKAATTSFFRHSTVTVHPARVRCLPTVSQGDRIYHGQVGGATCAACHGASGKGSPLGPDLTHKEWLWSDGSYAGIKKTITEGVMHPKQYRSPMPPMGGARLTPDQISALAAYIWSLSH